MLETQEPTSKRQHVTKKTLLIVEDDDGNGTFLVEAISQETLHRPLLAPTSKRAIEIVHHIKPDLFILDYRLDQMNGIELYDHLHAIKGLEAIPAIILSTSLQQQQHELDQRHLLGLTKPLDLDTFLQCIEQQLATQQKLR